MRDGQARLRGARTPGGCAGEATSALHVDGWNATRRFGPVQGPMFVAAILALAASLMAWPGVTWAVLQVLAALVFLAAIVMRAGAAALTRNQPEPPPCPLADLPSYTVIAPLYREARVCAQLIGALSRLDYPRERLQVILVLEADDGETLAELRRLGPGAPFQVFVAPQGWPKTKPRACNAALALARGELLVIYDAEDRPERGQLLEAAARFRAEPEVACFQAPLRVDGVKDFLTAQFALEYAAQFETLLPALHRLGAPFPLGGSSNHFRTAVLRGLGGWDAHNVTEDADLGLRLAAAGFRAGLLNMPTWERAPQTLGQWRPQRTRWIKGHLQTWLVHMRRPRLGGPGRFLALQATLGLGVLSALIHGPLTLLLAAAIGLELLGREAVAEPEALSLLCGGWMSALLIMRRGARRADVGMSWRDALTAPVYWPLHSLAAGHAVWEFTFRPFRWNKTDHEPAPLD